MDSILDSVKKMLGITSEYEQFDKDIIMHINSVFTILNQLGVGSEEGFTIADKSNKWIDFMGAGKTLEAIKSYVYLKVKLIFDPPSSSTALESYNKLISELEWRILLSADPKE